MKLRQAFLILSLLLIVMLMLIGGVTVGALSAFNDSNAMARHRQSSMTLMNEVRQEVELLGRLVSSYVSTANPRYLIYYYDILAIREGNKPRASDRPAVYWDQVIAGLRPYVPADGGELLPLVTRTGQLGFDAEEQRVVSRILELTEQMKQVEQVAFASTQGLYDPEKHEFVSEIAPQREYAAALLHGDEYLRLRADLVGAVEELARLVDARTQRNVDNASEKLQNLIISSLVLLVTVTIVLLLAYRYLTQRLLGPLLVLHDTASALAKKSYGQRVGNIPGFAEVRQLATTMDGMAAAIEADITQRELVQRELDEARARAEVAADAKSTFLATMSHEIRTPMNAILGMAYLALKSGLQPVQRNYVSKIHDAAKSLLGILNDILDYSKIEAGKVVLESEPFDLESVVQNAVFMVQQRAQDKQLEMILDFRLEHQNSAFIGDSLRLGQVLINLLSNAVKFTERGHVRLGVKSLGREGQIALLHFSVEDTGIGMTEVQQARLFLEFSQADGSTTRKYGGTGLGLSISKRLVQSMGGEILVHSELDRGSVFEFSIRLPISAAAGGLESSKIRRRRALVVDDYAGSRESMAGMLGMLGCPVVDQAGDGRKAIELLVGAQRAGRPYDLLLLDWLMPGLSGSGVLAEMKSRNLALPEKTIIVSALDSALLRQELLPLGLGDILQKPVFPNVLCEVANSALDDQAGGAAPVRPEQGSLLGMRVLVAEDNEINQQVAAEILCAWGVVVDLAADGQQALGKIFSHPPGYFALVLMDLDMPVLSGTEATRLLRANARYEALPVLAMTAHAVGEELHAAQAAGMNGHIPKPFQPDELYELLLKYRQPDVALPPLKAERPNLGHGLEAQALLDHLAAAPGVDGHALLERFPDRVPFICRMLRRFAAEQAGFVAELSLRLDSDDRDSALRQVHSLKGLSGNLCMNALQAAAQRLEDEIKLQGDNVGTCLSELSALLAPILSVLSGLPSEMFGPEGRAGKLGETAGIIRRLRRCLAEGDGEAEQLWLANHSLFANCFSLVDCKRLDWAISAWEFDEALRVLDAADEASGGMP